jgi:acetyl-CoA acetyltransferase
LFYQAESHRRAAAATASGKFKDEIVPVPTKVGGVETNMLVPTMAPFPVETSNSIT